MRAEPFRHACRLLTCLFALTLAGCVTMDDVGETNTLQPVLTSAVDNAHTAAATPIGLWRGGMTMLVVTTRNAVGDLTQDPWFGSQRASSVTAVRTILYPPSNTLLASMNPIASNDWSIAGVQRLPGDAPPQSIAAAAEGRDVLIYVHGFNETFDSATTSYAKLVSGIRFSGAPILFTWPSAGALLDYGYDRESAMWSRDALEDTIMALAQDSKVGHINILAHSMGSLVALEALRSITDRTNTSLAGRFGAIMLANPDVDIDLFKRQVSRLPSLVPKMSVIISEKDRALAISSRIAGGVARVGMADRADLEKTGVKVVDATDFGSGLINHDIFMSRPELHAVITRAIENADGSNGGS